MTINGAAVVDPWPSSTDLELSVTTVSTTTVPTLSVKGAKDKNIYISLASVGHTDVATVASGKSIAGATSGTSTGGGGLIAFCLLDMTNLIAHYDLKGTVMPIASDASTTRSCGFLLKGKTTAALTTAAMTATATTGATNHDATLNVEFIGLPNDNAMCTQTGRTITATTGGTAVAAINPFGYCW